MGKPPNSVQVYPDPDGAASNNQYVPSNVFVQGTSIGSGTVAVVLAAAGSGTTTNVHSFLFQSLSTGTAITAGNGFMGVHAADSRYVAAFLFFGSLSVVLSAINLVRGYMLREKLRKLSDKISGVCMVNGVFPWWVTEKKNNP